MIDKTTLLFQKFIHLHGSSKFKTAQSAGAEEYTDCISTEE